MQIGQEGTSGASASAAAVAVSAPSGGGGLAMLRCAWFGECYDLALKFIIYGFLRRLT